MNERTERALVDLEEAGHWLTLLAEHAPNVEPRPSWWRPLARHRHLMEHDESLACWAESIEQAAAEYREAEAALDSARRRDDMDEVFR